MATKNVSVQRIREAYDAGARDFGENRAQELLGKTGELPKDVRWHFIGHLQTNKAKWVVGACGNTSLLHSLDRMELAQEIQKQAEKKNVTVDALLQVNTSGESTKSGVRPEEAKALCEKIIPLNRLRLQGLMTIGPTPGGTVLAGTLLGTDPRSFAPSRTVPLRKLRELRDELQNEFRINLPHLSMGMSSDFEIAIEEGATMVRIGTAVFGERNP